LIRVTVVAPNLPLRVGLREMLSAGLEVEVSGEAPSLDEAALLLEHTDILLLAAPQPEDLRELADSGGGPAILLLSDERSDAQQLAGAERVWGILPLDAGEAELEAAIRALGEGLVVGAPSLLREAWRKPSVVPLNGVETAEQLTGREVEVLALMARGLANKQIAMELGISEHTVKFHLSSIYAKLGATGRAEAVSIGTRLGLIGL
jgi:DNA-binding NarL/FixJ family response regulator